MFKIGEAAGNLFEGNLLAGPVADMAFAKAPGNIIRDSARGKTFRVTLDSASSVSLQDSRGAIWLLSRAGLPTTAAPTRSSLNLTYASAGPSVSVTTSDLAVRPQSGTVEVRPGSWAGSSRSWDERPSGAGVVAHELGGLQAGACYGVTAGGKPIGVYRAGASGQISFVYTPAGSTSFAVSPSARCQAAAPGNHLLLPLIGR